MSQWYIAQTLYWATSDIFQKKKFSFNGFSFNFNVLFTFKNNVISERVFHIGTKITNYRVFCEISIGFTLSIYPVGSKYIYTLAILLYVKTNILKCFC